eukprot:gene2747-3041_t
MCRDTGNCTSDADCVRASTTLYEGPVPIVTHLHGNEGAFDFSDGYSEAWFLPDADNLDEYSTVGSWYNIFRNQSVQQLSKDWAPGSAVFTYKNTQRPTQLWYHDHVIGLTRLNVYAGLAGLYQLREVDIKQGPELPGLPWPPAGVGFPTDQVREIPLAIQDRAFDINSQLFYPKNMLNRSEVLPQGAVPPIWIPEFLGITLDGTPLDQNGTSAVNIIVNGKTWPRFGVTREPYRLRVLNGCNARTIILYFALTAPSDPANPIITEGRLPFYVIGNEGGFFPSLVGPRTSILLGPAERYDIIFDFSRIPNTNGKVQVYLLNEGPEVPYNGRNNGEQLNLNTAQVMRFDVAPGDAVKSFGSAEQAALDAALMRSYKVPNLENPVRKRQLTLIEVANPNGNVVAVYLGQANITNGVGVGIPKTWSDPVTTNPETEVVEDWEIINLTVDAHPIHIHEEYFQDKHHSYRTGKWDVTFVENAGSPVSPNVSPEAILSVMGPCSGGSCFVNKDTVLVPASTKYTFRLQFPREPGLFPWH